MSPSWTHSLDSGIGQPFPNPSPSGGPNPRNHLCAYCTIQHMLGAPTAESSTSPGCQWLTSVAGVVTHGKIPCHIFVLLDEDKRSSSPKTAMSGQPTRNCKNGEVIECVSPRPHSVLWLGYLGNSGLSPLSNITCWKALWQGGFKHSCWNQQLSLWMFHSPLCALFSLMYQTGITKINHILGWW
jgi:hypothetical protein